MSAMTSTRGGELGRCAELVAAMDAADVAFDSCDDDVHPDTVELRRLEMEGAIFEAANACIAYVRAELSRAEGAMTTSPVQAVVAEIPTLTIDLSGTRHSSTCKVFGRLLRVKKGYWDNYRQDWRANLHFDNGEVVRSEWWYSGNEYEALLADRLASAQSAGAGEPVAWLIKNPGFADDGDATTYEEYGRGDPNVSLIPLYAHPTPSEPDAGLPPLPVVFAERLADGWTFAYEPGTNYVGLNHPNGGRQSVLRVEYGVYDAEIGAALAAFLNNAGAVRRLGARGVDAKYGELLLAVACKYPGESRHETALRYIRERETRCDGAAKESRP
jgi:hypothetical protein